MRNTVTDCNFGILTSMFKLPNSWIFRNKQQLKTIQYSSEKKNPLSYKNLTLHVGVTMASSGEQNLTTYCNDFTVIKLTVSKLDKHRSIRVSKRFNTDSKPVTAVTWLTYSRDWWLEVKFGIVLFQWKCFVPSSYYYRTVATVNEFLKESHVRCFSSDLWGWYLQLQALTQDL